MGISYRYRETPKTPCHESMSYTLKEAKGERENDILLALSTRDSEALYHLANLTKEEGDDETAETLIKTAKRIDNEDWAFDRERDNQN